MDWLTQTHNIREVFKKYRYVVLVLLAGLFLMLLPEGEKQQKSQESGAVVSQLDDLENRLESILSQLYGAGKVKVLLSEASGEKVIYQVNETKDTAESSQSLRRDTVIISGSDRAEQGLVTHTLAPAYMGAVVLCQGADSAAVRLSIIEAVSNATGLSTNHISVFKMK